MNLPGIGFEVEEFEAHRRHLLGVAYRMLGTASEAEDMVQEAWLRWQQAPRHDVLNARSYLTTVVTRLCLDLLKSSRMHRELYVGQWLPEPIPAAEYIDESSPEAQAEAMESISFAAMVLLEKLGPVERAVFLLRDVFDFDYHEIAQVVGSDEASCRQTLRRARQHLTEGRTRFQSTYEDRLQLTAKFMLAAGMGDFSGLRNLLAEDVVEWGDGGGRVRAGIHPIYGREKVLRLIEHTAKEFAGAEVRMLDLNGVPAMVFFRDGMPTDVGIFEVADSLIQELRFIRNPDKLGAVRRMLDPEAAANIAAGRRPTA